MQQALDPTLYEITSQPKDGIAPDKVEKVIYEELDKVKTNGVTDKELQKAKNVLTAAFYRQMKTISGKANTLGSYEVFFGDYHKLFSADVKRVAVKYFTEKNRTVATLLPEKKETKPVAATAPAKSANTAQPVASKKAGAKKR